MNPALRVEGLTRRFGELVALDGVSFSVGEGELFGIVGPDGAGKTTLLRILAGDEPPFLERSVYYDGLTPESAEQLGELAEKVGMEALRRVNRRALVLQKRDAKRRGQKLRMNFGTYFFRAPTSGRKHES